MSKSFGAKQTFLGDFKSPAARIDYKKRMRTEPVSSAFPVNEPFESRSELEFYLSGDKIQCLLCGKEFKNLGNHLMAHNISGNDYRLRYNIPKKTGLCTKAASKALSDNISEEQKEHMSRISKLVNRSETVHTRPKWLRDEQGKRMEGKMPEYKKGEDSFNAKITNKQAVDIYIDYSQSDKGYGTVSGISRKFSITENIVRGIIKGRTYQEAIKEYLTNTTLLNKGETNNDK